MMVRDFEGLEKPLNTFEGLRRQTLLGAISFATKLRRWFEAALEVQEKARGKTRQPKDPRIANRIPPALLMPPPGPPPFQWPPKAIKDL